MERTVIRFQEPSNALWLTSHFAKKIDQAWVLLVGSNSVVARAIYGLTQAIKRRIPSLVLAWSHGSVITLSLLLSKMKSIHIEGKSTASQHQQWQHAAMAITTQLYKGPYSSVTTII